jgi:hypothetical protein
MKKRKARLNKLSIRLNDVELEIIKDKAWKEQLSLSEYVRNKAVKD